MILAILVEGHPRNIPVELLLKSGHQSTRICRLKGFFYF